MTITPRTVSKVRELLHSADFVAWHHSYARLREDLQQHRQHRDSILLKVHTAAYNADVAQREADVLLFKAGECQDTAARSQAADNPEAFVTHLMRSEFGYQARRVRHEAEALYEKSKSEQEHIGALHVELQKIDEVIHHAEIGLETLLDQARELFYCALVADFLYWPHVDNDTKAICVPLIDERVHLNVHVKALHLYEIERTKGIDFLVPLLDPQVAEEERLVSFFNESHEQPRAATL